MTQVQILAILDALANGVNPFDGSALPQENIYQHPDVIRALFAAIKAVEPSQHQQETRKRERKLPAQAGQPWSSEEDAQLLQEFERGIPIAALAGMHKRSRAAIQARLEKHGKLT